MARRPIRTQFIRLDSIHARSVDSLTASSSAASLTLSNLFGAVGFILDSPRRKSYIVLSMVIV